MAALARVWRGGDERLLFPGGLSGNVGLFLLGLSVTALVGLLGALATQDRIRVGLVLHVLMCATYVPIIVLGVNGAAPTLVPTTQVAIAFLALSSVAALASHALLVLVPRARQPFIPSLAIHAVPGGSTRAIVLVNATVADYRAAILEVESKGRDFAYVQNRIAPYFCDDQTLAFIANQRFGAGHPERSAYVAAHQRRRQAFFAMLDSGARFRELLPRASIQRYVATGTHAAKALWPIPVAAVESLLTRWGEAILKYPNYNVGISDQELPIKILP